MDVDIVLSIGKGGNVGSLVLSCTSLECHLDLQVFLDRPINS